MATSPCYPTEYKMSLKSLQKRFRSLAILLLLVLFGGVFSPVLAALPDTGQTKCYNDSVEIACPQPGQDYYGQDANYNTINPPSYTKLDANGNALPDSATTWAMVKDNVTGLIWENKTTDGSIHDSGKTYNWNDAQNVFIVQLNSSKFGVHNDWRLPTIEELRSILDYGRYFPAIDTGYFPSGGLNQSLNYWSSSVSASDTSYAWGVTFYSGDCYLDNKSGSYYVRAVRGSRVVHSSTDNCNGTITDTNTGMMWQQATGNNGGSMTWKAALAYCQSLNLDVGYAGYTDWRLPNIKELEYLIDLSRLNPAPAIDPKFSDTKPDGYWSSSTYASTFYAWLVIFTSNGYKGITYKSNSYYVRCVRSGITDPSQCTDTNGSTQEGINLVKAKPGDYGLFDQTQL